MIATIHTYVINLDRDSSRWKHIQESFQGPFYELSRVSAIDGNELALPSPYFDATRFRLLHGRLVNIYEIACYMSHIKAIQAFLKTNQEHALFCEDDIVVHPELESVIATALQEKNSWNILRLSGLSVGHPIFLKKLTENYSLSLELGRLKGAGAYILDRKAAQSYVKHLVPMWLPWDHAFDREWFFGLKALVITPFPMNQTEDMFPSNIQKNSQPKCSTLQRWCTTYPYQIFNELMRYLLRLSSLIVWMLRISQAGRR